MNDSIEAKQQRIEASLDALELDKGDPTLAIAPVKFPVVRLSEVPMTGPPKFLIDKLWTENSVGIVGGDPKTLKSFHTLALGIHVAAGMPVYKTHEVEQGRVLIYNAEDKPARTRYRAEGICRALGIELGDLDIRLVDTPSLFADSQDDIDKLHAAVEEFKPKLLILDPLRNLHVLDENDSRVQPLVLTPIRGIQKAHGCSIMVVHHLVKGADGKRSVARLRGSGAIRGWYDCALIMDRPTHDSPVRVDVEHRDAEAEPYAFTFKSTTAESGEPAFWFELAKTEGEKPSLEEQVIALKAGGMSGNKALEALRAEKVRFRNDDFWSYWKR